MIFGRRIVHPDDVQMKHHLILALDNLTLIVGFIMTKN